MSKVDKNEIINKYNECFSWINSIHQPICKKCSNINDLRDGNVFLELIKYYFNYNQKNPNYLSLLNRANNAENTFERMNIIFHTMNKMINNNKIKSRIEEFHNDINSFLKNDNLILEFLIYIISFFQKNKNDSMTSWVAKQNNNNNNNKYRKKIINFNSVNEENKNSNEKNNFLFYINNKNENIINIDNVMNFRFINGINDLKAQNNNINLTKEIKSYVTKPKIIKYHSQNFNHYKESMNKNDKNRKIKNEINFNNLKRYLKNEENKINLDGKEIDNINTKNVMLNYHTYKQINYNPIKNILEEEKKLKYVKEDKKEINPNDEKRILSYDKKEINLFKLDKNERNSFVKNDSEEMSIYKLLRLSNNNIKKLYNDKIIEEKKIEEFENRLNKISPSNKIKNQKRLLYSRNNRHNRNIINNKKSEQNILNNKIKDNIESFRRREIKRQISFPNKNTNIKYLNGKNEFNETIYNQAQKTHTYFPKNHSENINKKTKELFNEEKNSVILRRNLKKEKIYSWLVNLKVIKKEETNIIYLIKLISDGKLLCDIINACENEDNQINNILNETSIQENAIMNLRQALEHLNKIKDFPKSYISDYEPIFEIDNKVIWGLLNDLFDYYSNKVEIENIIQEEDIIISSDINNKIINNSDFNDDREKYTKKKNKKSSMEISDAYLYINNHDENKIITHKNNNIKNILFKDTKHDQIEYNKYSNTYGSDNNNIKYYDSYNKISNVNYKEKNIKNNSINFYKEDENENIKLVKPKKIRKNYFYYVNALKDYFDQEKKNQKQINQIDNYNMNEIMTSYSKNNKYKSFNLNKNNNNNNLYFNYKNIIFSDDNKNPKYSCNPINPDYYKINYFNLHQNDNYISDY